jgi:hypothetical protein
LTFKWLSYFGHAIQTLVNTHLFGIRSQSHTKPRTIPI